MNPDLLLKQGEAYLRRAATRSIANEGEMGVIFLDFDDFKSVNDTMATRPATNFQHRRHHAV